MTFFFNKISELVEKDEDNYYIVMMALLSIISIKLPELCDNHHSSLVTKYILSMSILLDPSCLSARDSTNTSLYTFSKDVYIKKSTSPINNYFKNLFSSFYKIVLY